MNDEHGREIPHFDLEAQRKILEIAVKLDSRKAEFASSQDLVRAGQELGISEDSMLSAIEQFESNLKVFEEQRSAPEVKEKLPVVPLALNLLQLACTYALCLAWSRYNISLSGAATYALIGIGLSFAIGLTTGQSPGLLTKSLKLQALAVPVALILTIAWNSLTGYPTMSGAHWLYNSLSYVSCLAIAMCVGAKVVHKSRFSIRELLAKFLGEGPQAV